MEAYQRIIRILLFTKYLDHPMPWRFKGHRILDAVDDHVVQCSEEESKVLIEEMGKLYKELDDEDKAIG